MYAILMLTIVLGAKAQNFYLPVKQITPKINSDTFQFKFQMTNLASQYEGQKISNYAQMLFDNTMISRCVNVKYTTECGCNFWSANIITSTETYLPIRDQSKCFTRESYQVPYKGECDCASNWWVDRTLDAEAYISEEVEASYNHVFDMYVILEWGEERAVRLSQNDTFMGENVMYARLTRNECKIPSLEHKSLSMYDINGTVYYYFTDGGTRLFTKEDMCRVKGCDRMYYYFHNEGIFAYEEFDTMEFETCNKTVILQIEHKEKSHAVTLVKHESAKLKFMLDKINSNIKFTYLDYRVFSVHSVGLDLAYEYDAKTGEVMSFEAFYDRCTIAQPGYFSCSMNTTHLLPVEDFFHRCFDNHFCGPNGEVYIGTDAGSLVPRNRVSTRYNADQFYVNFKNMTAKVTFENETGEYRLKSRTRSVSVTSDFDGFFEGVYQFFDDAVTTIKNVAVSIKDAIVEFIYFYVGLFFALIALILGCASGLFGKIVKCFFGGPLWAICNICKGQKKKSGPKRREHVPYNLV